MLGLDIPQGASYIYICIGSLSPSCDRGPKLISSPLLSRPSRYFGHLYCTLIWSLIHILHYVPSLRTYTYTYVWLSIQKQYVHMYIYVDACMHDVYIWMRFPIRVREEHSIGSSMSFWVFFVNPFSYS